MSNNLELWNNVCKTNPADTKGAKVSGMKITAICPQSQRKAATEQFGPYGQGWGVKDGNYSFMDIGKTKLCTYTAKLWYRFRVPAGEQCHPDRENTILYKKEICEFPIQANIKVVYWTKKTDYKESYEIIDDEYAKKVSTDALTKGLSMLGFNSDVFEGKFDDNKYVNQMKEEFREPDQLEEKIYACQSFPELMELWEGLDEQTQNTYKLIFNDRKKSLKYIERLNNGN